MQNKNANAARPNASGSSPCASDCNTSTNKVHTNPTEEKTMKRLSLAVTLPLCLWCMWLVVTQPHDTSPLEQLLYLFGYLISAMLAAYGAGWIDE
jgi:hypothetical protein